MHGKRIVLKNLALAKLTNIFMMLLCPPGNCIAGMQTCFFLVCVDKGPDKIKQRHMLVEFDIPCLKTYNESLKLSWMKRYVCSVDTWKYLVDKQLLNEGVLFSCGDKRFSR